MVGCCVIFVLANNGRSLTKDLDNGTETAPTTYPGNTTRHRQKPVFPIQEIHSCKQREVQATMQGRPRPAA